jgi:hypothetical protein
VRRPLTASPTRGLLLLAATVVLAGCSREEPIQFEQGRGNEAEVGLATGLVLYGLVPLLILLAIAALVWLPGMVRSSRYRPGRGWSAPPVWFAGPPDPAAAVEHAQVDEGGRGGASGNW